MNALSEIKTLIEHLEGLKRDKEALEASLKAVNEQIEYFATDIIPGYIQDLGLEEVKLDTGLKITVATKYFANISEERADAAHKWMEENELGALLKTTIGMTYGAGLAERVDMAVLKQFLAEKEIGFNEKKSVHPATLKAMVKRELENGHKIPLGLFGIHIVKEIQVAQTNKQT